MDTKRIIGLTIGVLATVLVLMSGLSRSWWDSDEARLTIGPRGLEDCTDDTCVTQSLDGLDGGDDRWKRWLTFGKLTHVGAIATAAFLVISMVLGALRTGRHLAAPGIVAAVASIVYLVVASAFFGLIPEAPGEASSVGAGYFIALAGGVLGGAAGILLSRRPVRRPFRVTPSA